MKNRPIVAVLLSTLAVLPLSLALAQEEGGTKPEGTPGGPSAEAKKEAPRDGDRRGPGGPGGDRGPGGPGAERGPGGDRGPGRPQPPKFEDLDTDKSGDVSEAEFVAFQVKQAEERAKQMFGRVDRNNDGKLTEDEMPRPREGGPREGGQRGPGMRDGEGGPRGPRDGDKAPGSGPGDGGGVEPKRPEVEA